NKFVTFNRLESSRKSIVLQFVIARNNRNFPFVFHTYLGRTNNMTSRVKRHFYAIYIDGFVVADTLNLNIRTNANMKNGNCEKITQVFFQIGRASCRGREELALQEE